MPPGLRSLLLWGVLFASVVALFGQIRGGSSDSTIPYSEFMRRAQDGAFVRVRVDGTRLLGHTDSNQVIVANAPPDVFMVSDLRKAGVDVEAEPENEPSLLMTLFISWFPMMLLIGLWVFFMRQMQGGRGGAFSFGKSRARMTGENDHKITFEDVAGCKEAKEEVAELVDFLRNPVKFRKLGAKIPRGILMVGNRAPVKHYWRVPSPVKRKCLFSISPALILLKCLSGSALPECETCLNRPKKVLLVLYLLTK